MSGALPVHPGEHLAEFLAEFGVSQYRLAKEIVWIVTVWHGAKLPVYPES